MKERSTHNQVQDATARLEKLFCGPLSGYEYQIGSCQRAMHNRAVFTGKMGSTPVIFKQLIGDRSTERCAKIWDLQTEKFAALPSSFSIAQPLACHPEHGLLVIKFISGATFNEHLRTAKPEDVAALCEKAGRWLREYTASSTKQDKLFPHKLLDRTQSVLSRMNPPEADTAQECVDILRSMAPKVRQLKSLVGRIHGDFAPMNLMLSDTGQTIGIDVESNFTLPALADVAKFLVLANHYRPLTSDQYFGLSKNLVDHFAQGWGGLSADDTTTLLPFFLGRALVDHLSAEGQSPKQLADRHDALLRFLEAIKNAP